MSSISRIARIVVLGLIISTTGVVSAAAQTCLGIDACLLSPTRANNGRPITPNGCSVPPELGAQGQFWGAVFTTACNQHDLDWGTFKSDINAWFTQSNLAFRNNLLAVCQSRNDLARQLCNEVANLFFLGVSTTTQASQIFRQAQYDSSSCACQGQGPTAPSNFAAQVTSGPGGAQVTFTWAPSANATSYQLDVIQPPLGSISTNSAVPTFTAAGVPNGTYRLQVRAVGATGTSGPSNVIDVVVGSSAPCAPPTAPTNVAASLSNGTATVTWAGVAGATNYILRAGLTSGSSDVFDGNVGGTTQVSASGLPGGFRAFVRVHAVNACGTSAASAEAVIGS